jgi:hypothetical protein
MKLSYAVVIWSHGFIKSYRSFKHVSEQEFLKELQEMNFNNISKHEDLDEAYSNFENSIIKTLDKHAPNNYITSVFHWNVTIWLGIECILLKFHWGMKALTEVHFQWSVVALHVENVVRSTLSYPNETSKECIQ